MISWNLFQDIFLHTMWALKSQRSFWIRIRNVGYRSHLKKNIKFHSSSILQRFFLAQNSFEGQTQWNLHFNVAASISSVLMSGTFGTQPRGRPSKKTSLHVPIEYWRAVLEIASSIPNQKAWHRFRWSCWVCVMVHVDLCFPMTTLRICFGWLRGVA